MNCQSELIQRYFPALTPEQVEQYRMMDELYEKCAAEKDKLSVPGAKHDESCEKAPELYWEKTDAFIAKYMEL